MSKSRGRANEQWRGRNEKRKKREGRSFATQAGERDESEEKDRWTQIWLAIGESKKGRLSGVKGGRADDEKWRWKGKGAGEQQGKNVGGR
jgi:hypothetical protein